MPLATFPHACPAQGLALRLRAVLDLLEQGELEAELFVAAPEGRQQAVQHGRVAVTRDVAGVAHDVLGAVVNVGEVAGQEGR